MGTSHTAASATGDQYERPTQGATYASMHSFLESLTTLDTSDRYSVEVLRSTLTGIAFQAKEILDGRHYRSIAEAEGR